MPAVTGASYNNGGDTSNSPRGVFIGVNISGTASNSRLTDCEIVSSTVALYLSYATNCVIHNSDVGLYVGAGGYTVKQCLFYKNKTDIFTATGTSGTRKYSHLYSCTFANRTSNDYISPNYRDFYFINCISSKPFYEGSAYNTVNSIGITDTACAGNTLFTSLASNFVNASANNYALKSGSQAIGCGNDNQCDWDVDLAGNKRKQGVIDVGAYEYQPVTQLTKPTVSVLRPSATTAQVVLSSYDEHLSGYWIEYANNATFSNAKTVKQEDASVDLYTLSRLQNNVYYWRVMLYGDGVNYADSEWSDTVVTRKKLDAPTISKASNTDTSVVIEVKDKNVNATGWKMQYRENTLSSSFGTAVDVTLDGNSCFEITGLASGTDYVIQVQAVGDGVNYDSSEWAETTVPTAVVLSAPTIDSVTASGAHTLVVAITAVEHASGYALQYKETSNDVWTDVPGATFTQGSASITGLTNGVTYGVRVRALGDGSAYVDSAYTESSGTTGSEPLTAPTLTVGSGKSTAWFHVFIHGIDERAYGVDAFYQGPNDSELTIGEIADNGEIYVEDNLTEGTTYRVKVIVRGDGVAWSDASAEIDAKTYTHLTLSGGVALSNAGQHTVDISGLNSANAVGYEIFVFTDGAEQYDLEDYRSIEISASEVTDGVYTISGFDCSTLVSLVVVRAIAAEDSDTYVDSLEYSTRGAGVTTLPIVKLSVGWATLDNTTPGVLNIGQLICAGASSRIIAYKLQSSSVWTEISLDGDGVGGGTYSLSGLEYGALYHFRWKAVGDDYSYTDSDWSQTTGVQVSAPTQLTAPVIMNASGGTDSIEVIFFPIGVGTLEVYYSTSNNIAAATLGTVVNNTFTLTGCSEGTKYYIWARTTGEAPRYLNSPYTETNVTTKIRLNDITVSPQADFRIGDHITATGSANVGSATCAWTWYGIKKSDSTVMVVLKTENGTSSSYDVSSTDYVNYGSITLKANGTGDYLGTIQKSIGTISELTLPAPSNVAVSPIGEKRLTVTFTANPVGSVVLEYSTDSNFVGAVSIPNFTSGTAVTNLDDDTTYFIRLQSVGDGNGIISSGWSTRVQAKTTFPLAEPEMTVLSTGHTFVTFTIGAVANAVSYKVKITNAVTGESTETVYASVGQKTITGLSHNTAYYITAAACADSLSTLYYTPAYGVATPFETAEDTVPTIVLEGPVCHIVEQSNAGVWEDPGVASITDEEDELDDLTVHPVRKYFNYDPATHTGTVVSGDISLSMTGVYTVVYSATDTAGNTGYAYRTVKIVPSAAPTIRLYGGRFVGVKQGGAYVEPGAIAYDNVDTPVNVVTSSIVRVTGFNDDLAQCTGTAVSSISTSEPAIYRIGYSVTDSAGNIADTVYRLVVVMNDKSPDIILIGDPLVELDARPGTWTDPGVSAVDSEGNEITASGFGPNKVYKSIRLKNGAFVDSVDTTMGDSFLISYLAVDSDKNATITNRVVIVRGTLLKQEIKGNWDCGIVQGQPYNDPSVTVSGATLGSGPTATFEPPLDVDTVGVYEETYTSTDAKGNSANDIVRSVYVTEPGAPRIVIQGINPDYTLLKVPYEDAGAKVVDENNNPIEDASVTVKIRDHEGNDIGTTLTAKNVKYPYYITYLANVNDMDAIPETRVVFGYGWGDPTIELNGDSETSVVVGEYFADDGAWAKDVADEWLTVHVTIAGSDGRIIEEKDVAPDANGVYVFTYSMFSSNVIGNYTFTYTATDERGYVTNAVKRIVSVNDFAKPAIILYGDRFTRVDIDGEYEELGAYVRDEYDGVIQWTAGDGARRIGVQYYDSTGNIVTDIDTSQPCVYTVVYSYTNKKGKTGVTERMVSVGDLTLALACPKLTLLEVGIDSYDAPDNPVKVLLRGTDVTSGSSIEEKIYFTDNKGVSSVVDTIVNTYLGKYEIGYRATYNGNDSGYAISRTVQFIDTTAPVITLVGDANPKVMAGSGEVYTDPGVRVVSENSQDPCEIVLGGDGRDIDWDTPGRYEWTYQAVDSSGNVSNTLKRNVFVIDPNSPVIYLNGDSETFVEIGAAYEDQGVVVKNVLGNVMTDVTVTVEYQNKRREVIESISTEDFGVFYVVYYAETEDGLPAFPVERRVTVGDTTAPIIQFAAGSGANIRLGLGDVFNDPGVVVTDNYKKRNPTVTTTVYKTAIADGNIVDSVFTNAEETYFIKYEAIDSSGNYSSLTRRIDVADGAGPTIIVDDEITVEAGSEFTPPEPTVSDDSGEEVEATIISNTVNTKIIGVYYVVYASSDSKGNYSEKVLIVNVRDRVAPVITLTEPTSEILVQRGDETFVDPGATAVDTFEGDVDVEARIVSVDDNGTAVSEVAGFDAMIASIGRYKVIYTAQDSSGNTATAHRLITVRNDITPPEVTITSPREGYVLVDLSAGDTYTEPTAVAYDAFDDRTWTNEELTKVSNVDATLAGNYSVSFSATDASGNTGTAVAPVYVTTQESPVITLNGDASVRVVQGGSYADAGATAVYVDEHGTHNATVTSTGTVNTDVPGVYKIVYNAFNGAIPARPVERTVEVVPTVTAVATEPSKLKITFSKGAPGANYILKISSDNTNWVNADCTTEFSGTVQATRFVNVEPNTVYYFKVVRYGSEFASDVLTKRTYLVENLAVDVTEPTQATLSWDALDGASYYIVEMIDEDLNHTVVKDSSAAFTGTSVDLTIEPDMKYTFRVKADKTDVGVANYATINGGSILIHGLDSVVRSSYIKLMWDASKKASGYTIKRINGSEVVDYSSVRTSWYNTKSEGANGPFEYNIEYTYQVKAIRDEMTAFASTIYVTAKKNEFTDFSGINYYYIGGEYGSFQKREDWSLEMNGDPLDFAPNFGEGYRFCIGVNALIDELPGSYNNVSDKGVVNIRVYNGADVDVVSSYEQVEVLHLKVDGALTFQLNLDKETHFDPVGVSKGVHLGKFNDINNVVLAKGLLELTAGSVIQCVGKNGDYICLTDNLKPTNLNIDKSAKIYANVNRPDRPFKCWMYSYGWERTKTELSASNSSPLTLTNNVYVRNLVIPVNPVITGNYRRFVIDGDVKPSDTSSFYWSSNIGNTTVPSYASGSLLAADTDAKQEQFQEILAEILDKQRFDELFENSDAGSTLAASLNDVAKQQATAYYTSVINSESRQWGVWPNGIAGDFIKAAKASVTDGVYSDEAVNDLTEKYERYLRWIGNYFYVIAGRYTTSKTVMKEPVEFCLVKERDQRVSLVPGVEFVYPVKIRKRNGMVTFEDIIVSNVQGVCGFNNMLYVEGSGVTVRSTAEITIVSDSKFADFILYGKLNIDEDIELKVYTSETNNGSQISGHCQNPNKTGGYLYIVNKNAQAIVDKTMDVGTWIEPLHYYYVGGSTGSFDEPTDWFIGREYMGASMMAIIDPPKTRDGNVFHIERAAGDAPVVISGLETSQIVSPMDANDCGKISVVTSGKVTISADTDYNHIDTVVINGGELTFTEKSFIGYIEEYNGGKLTIPSGYVGGVTFAYPNAPNDDNYYLDTREPVDYNVECYEDRCVFTYDDLIGMITTHDTGTVYSVGNDIHLAADSTTDLLGEANNLYIYGQDVTISGNQRFVGVYGSVTGTGSLTETEVYAGGSLTYSGRIREAATIYGQAELHGYAENIAVYGSATIGACFSTAVVQAEGSASFVANSVIRCAHHAEGDDSIPCNKSAVYIYGTATMDAPIGYTIIENGIRRFFGTTEIGPNGVAVANGVFLGNVKNEGTLTTNGETTVYNIANHGTITINADSLKVLGNSSRYAGVVQGDGQYLLKWNRDELKTEGTITAFIQDYDIPEVSGVHHDEVGAFWNDVTGAKSYIVRVVEQE